MSRQATADGADSGGNWVRMLRARPVPNAAATVAREDNQQVRLTVPRRRPGYLAALRWLVRPKPNRTVILDRLGGQIWRSCDGQRTVEEVVDVFAAAQRLSFHEARAAVTGYLKDLIERGAVAIVMPGEGDSGPGAAAETAVGP